MPTLAEQSVRDLPSDAFPTTHWSQIGLAGHHDTSVRDEALARLLQQYNRPMQVHLWLRSGLDVDFAEEIVQEFVINKVIRHRLFARAVEGKGRFRTYLLTALDRFAWNALRDRRTARGQSLEDLPEPVDDRPAADADFDAAWAREVLRHAMNRMRDECQARGREDIWQVFHSRVIAPAFDGDTAVPYEQLVQKLRLDSPSEGFNLLATAKRSFARALRAVVGEYEKDPKLIDQEIADLRAALARGR